MHFKYQVKQIKGIKMRLNRFFTQDFQIFFVYFLKFQLLLELKLHNKLFRKSSLLFDTMNPNMA